MVKTTQRRTTDRAKLDQLEDVLSTARRWAMEEARALLAIRELGLWMVHGYDSFESYGLQKWGFEHSQLYRLVQWAVVNRILSPLGESVLPQRETHARPLYGLTDDQVTSCWRAVIRTRLPVTASLVAETVQGHLRREAPLRLTGDHPRGSGTVIVSDAVIGLATLQDKSVSLLLTSPPYAMQRAKDFPSVEEREFPTWIVSVLDSARPKLVDGGNILIVIREHVRNGVISDYLLRTRLAIRDAGWHEIDVLIWSKPDSPPTGRMDRPRRAYEYVLWYSNSISPHCDPRACGARPTGSRDGLSRPRYVNIKAGHHGNQPFSKFRHDDIARVTDVISAAVGTNSKNIDHPAVFPLPLADQLIRTYSVAGGLVVDPFCGSGTTLLAAKEAGRRYFGCDLVPRYVAMARKRLLA